jgi:hypothetical protein
MNPFSTNVTDPFDNKPLKNEESFHQSISKNIPEPEPETFSKYKVKGLYDFGGMRGDDLSFIVGDIMTVLQEHGEWLYGTSSRTALTGWFPKNYTEVILSNPKQMNSKFKNE